MTWPPGLHFDLPVGITVVRATSPQGGQRAATLAATFVLPRGAPAAKRVGSLPPLPPPPVRCHAAPCEAGTTQAGTALRFTAEDSRNPCQLASNADSRAQPGPQRRGLRPLREERWGCQKRAPPDAPPDEPPPPFSVAHEYDATALTPRGGNRRSIRGPWAPGFPAPIGGSSLRWHRSRHGFRRCPNRYQRWLAEEPPLLAWSLSGCPGLDNLLGAVETVLVPLRRRPVQPSYTLGRFWFSLDEPHSLSMLPLCQVFPEGRTPVWLPSRRSVF